MPIKDTTFRAFSWDNINKAPKKPGVYALFSGSALIYYGKATTSIASRLAAHKRGDEGSCTQQATTYKREVTTSPASRERELLTAYRATNGRLPRCNNVIP